MTRSEHMILVQRPFIIISEMPLRQRLTAVFFLYRTFALADAASNNKEQILSLLKNKFNNACLMFMPCMALALCSCPTQQIPLMELFLPGQDPRVRNSFSEQKDPQFKCSDSYSSLTAL